MSRACIWELYEKDSMGRLVHFIECEGCGKVLPLGLRLVVEDIQRGIASMYLMCSGCKTNTCVEVFKIC